LNDLWSIGVTKRRITIPLNNSELPTTDLLRKNNPKINVEMAKGKVSKRGASELSSPSLLCPILLLMKEPILSPIMHPNPMTDPIINAEIISLSE
tara:strand:- start:12 stop:296 length:285 start_codon:yes stop_codon:yes gene_type:complete